MMFFHEETLEMLTKHLTKPCSLLFLILGLASVQATLLKPGEWTRCEITVSTQTDSNPLGGKKKAQDIANIRLPQGIWWLKLDKSAPKNMLYMTSKHPLEDMVKQGKGKSNKLLTMQNDGQTIRQGPLLNGDQETYICEGLVSHTMLRKPVTYTLAFRVRRVQQRSPSPSQASTVDAVGTPTTPYAKHTEDELKSMGRDKLRSHYGLVCHDDPDYKSKFYPSQIEMIRDILNDQRRRRLASRSIPATLTRLLRDTERRQRA